MHTDPSFDPDAPATPGAGIFGLHCTRDTAGVVLVPVPFDATSSYRTGAALGPDAIRKASVQVDLYDHTLGRIYERGIYMEPTDESIMHLSEQTRAIAEPIIAGGGATDADAVQRIDAAGERVNAFVQSHTAAILAESRTPGIVGGEHSVSLGAIRAVAEHFGPASPIGVLQIDAHMDLRDRYHGLRYSHASIMRNVLEQVPGVERIVQVGVRDFGQGELQFANEHDVRVWYDDELFRKVGSGESFADLCRAIIDDLPERVYVSFDIDGLDPSLCPDTGTPVPGGLSFREAALLLHTLAESDRTVVGFDLVEVCPGQSEWDANVGARILYKLCSLT